MSPADQESTIDRERVYTKGARALDAAILGVGPTSSPGFLEGAKFLLDIANRVSGFKGAVWHVDIEAAAWTALSSASLPQQATQGFDARQNFLNVLSEISDPHKKSDQAYLQILRNARHGATPSADDDIDALSKTLADDLSQFKD